MGIPAVYFPRCLSWPRSNGGGRGEEGRNEGWIDTRRNIEFLLIPSLRARTIERERERERV